MGKRVLSVVLVLCLCLEIFPPVFSDFNHPSDRKKSSKEKRFGSSAVLPVQGSVYPLGYYYVSIEIGNPPKRFELDIDSGSDLTWVQCDAPCNGCTKPRHALYKPNNNILHCIDPICTAIVLSDNNHCEIPTDQCDYEIGYADHGSSLGVLVHDRFLLRFINGSNLGPSLAFGCGYDQSYEGAGSPPPTAGVLGLGYGKASILSQLSQMGLTRNIVGHCLGSRGGFLFFGDDFIPSSGISWTSISHHSFEKHYSSGPAELLFRGKPVGVKGLDVVFDSGSSYTYFNSEAYEAVVHLVIGGLKGTPLKNAPEDGALPNCWKGDKAFKSVQDAHKFFSPLALRFTKYKEVQLQIPPESYLIITEHGSACLGILNGTEVGLGSHNLIGDISMQGKIVIYDNEKKQIGWAPANCDRLPNVDDVQIGDFSSPYAMNFGMVSADSTTYHSAQRKLQQQFNIR